MKPWSLQLGQQISRVELHAQYGVSGQRGIAPSSSSRNILLFSGPQGEQYGYRDTLHNDECFHYTGEGQFGDQSLDRGNKSVLLYRERGRAIRLFDGARGVVSYVGEFGLDAEKSYYFRNAPDLNGHQRRVVVFRLRPIGRVHYGSLA